MKKVSKLLLGTFLTCFSLTACKAELVADFLGGNKQESPKPVSSATPLSSIVETAKPNVSPSPVIDTEITSMKFVELKTGYEDKTQLAAIYPIDFKNVWAVGTKGTIIHTTDGGINWTMINKGDKDLKSVFFLNSNLGWIAGANGVIFKTIDGGQTWTLQDSTAQGAVINDIKFYDESNGVFVSDKGVYHSQDGGNTWIKKGDIFANSITYRPDGIPIIYTIGSGLSSDNSSLYKYSKGVWEKNINLGSSYNSIYYKYNISLSFPTSLIGWLYWGNSIQKTVDGGDNWTKIEKFNTGSEFLTLSQVNPRFAQLITEKVGIIIAYPYNYALITKDGGITWGKISVEGFMSQGTTIGIVSIGALDYFYGNFYFKDLSHGWLLGNNQTIYRLGTP